MARIMHECGCVELDGDIICCREHKRTGVPSKAKEEDPETLLADGFEQAFIGYQYNKEHSVYQAIYDADRCVAILMREHGLQEEDAEEYFEYNVEGAYMGPGTPIFLRHCTLDEFASING